ncbi:MAG: Crp/Fnr family transcriptional regulator [Desulfitobacteriaceae bacterium]
MSKEQEIRQTLLSVPNWVNLPEEFLDFFLTRGRVRHYLAKQYLYFSGDEANTVFVLLKGRVQLLLTGEFSEKIFRVLRPPAFFPEVVLDGKPYPHAALALEATDVLGLDRETLKQFLETHAQLIWPFFQGLSLDLRRSYRQIKNLSLGDARLRLGAKLFALAHAHGKPTEIGVLISIPLSATELAGMCSLARESVSRILSELKASGIIEVEKKNITIRDPQTLRQWIHERANLKSSI